MLDNLFDRQHLQRQKKLQQQQSNGEAEEQKAAEAQRAKEAEAAAAEAQKAKVTAAEAVKAKAAEAAKAKAAEAAKPAEAEKTKGAEQPNPAVPKPPGADSAAVPPPPPPPPPTALSKGGTLATFSNPSCYLLLGHPTGLVLVSKEASARNFKKNQILLDWKSGKVISAVEGSTDQFEWKPTPKSSP